MLKMFRAAVSLMTACVLLVSFACAEPLTQEEQAYWLTQWETVCGFGVRQLGTDALEESFLYMVDEAEKLGYTYDDERLMDYTVEARETESYNLEAILPARTDSPNIIAVTAHYDSHAPGARDNTSGVASVMTLMKMFAERGEYDDTELRFVAFTGEETGHYGSLDYAYNLMDDEQERLIAVFNLDVVTVGTEEGANFAFSCDTLGMRTENGYQAGTEEAPACNKPLLAMRKAMEETGHYPAAEEGIRWCVPRHLAMSDHESFHEIGVDAVNVCFRGNAEEGGSWSKALHQPYDDVDDSFDLQRTWDALETVYMAIDGLAQDASYGF